MSDFSPKDSQELQDIVTWARARDVAGEVTSLEIIGGGSKQKLGRMSPCVHKVSLQAFQGIGLYEPQELVLAAGAATPMNEVEQALAAQNQQFAFEPPDFSKILGSSNSNQATLGGMLCSGFAGPRRLSAGGVRDHVLGFHGVNGFGAVIKAGGRVVKNVSGFDLPRLMAGSWGTLAILTDVTFKVLPAPKDVISLLLFHDTFNALEIKEIHRLALAGNEAISAAACLPGLLVRQSSLGNLSRDEGALSLFRLEGDEISSKARASSLAQRLSQCGATSMIEKQQSLQIWREIRDLLIFSNFKDWQIWRLSVPPTIGPKIAEELCARLSGHAMLDWGGGLIWFAMPARNDAGADLVRSTIPPGMGHATLFRADPDVRARVDVFQPLGAALERLEQRVAQSFDPQGIFNRGRRRVWLEERS